MALDRELAEAEHRILLRTMRAACEGLDACDAALAAVEYLRLAPEELAIEKAQLNKRRETWLHVIEKLRVELDAIDPPAIDEAPCDRQDVQDAQ